MATTKRTTTTELQRIAEMEKEHPSNLSESFNVTLKVELVYAFT